jgi:glyoxylase-like metal-dependent hydrolase (beta-lactamase superfamily II)
MNKTFTKLFLFFTLSLGLSASIYASDVLTLQKLTENVYAIIGPMGNRDETNLGNNANFGFIVTDQGVVLIDPGGTYRGAEEIHKLIDTVSNKPVKIVINTGGQDHRWLGNSYFKPLGATIIANKAAVADQKARQQDQFFMLGNLVGVKGLTKTEAIYADEVFDTNYKASLGGVAFEIHHLGTAHTPGDSFVWLPQQKILFSGDIVFVDRMLGVIDVSNSKSWISVFEGMAKFKPEILVPGHGPVTTLKKAKADTYDYLLFLRKTVSTFMEEGGGIENVGKLDQSRFKYLKNYDSLKGRNAQKVYEELEWE